jgi:hypothetical protein
LGVKAVRFGIIRKFSTDHQRQDLRIGHRKERDRRVADRIKDVLLADKGWSYVHIAEVLILDEETISRHIDEYLYQNKLKPENGGSAPKLNESQAADLIAHLEKQTYLRVGDIDIAL